jgi:hypothetical protein
VGAAPLDLSLSFLPEALAGLVGIRALDEDADRLRMNQIRAASYLRIFDLLETCLAEAVRAHATRDVDARDTLAPLLRLDAFDHNELFHGFERAFAEAFPMTPKLVERPADLDEMLTGAVPLSLLVLALHLKLVTQQHYLACVRGAESLEPAFVRVLKDHWTLECGQRGQGGSGERRDSVPPPSGATSSTAIQQSLATALPGRVPAALRDYRRILFAIDDVLRRQSELDVATFEAARGAGLSASERESVLDGQIAAQRNTFITLGIVNAAFVYTMSSLGPTAPAMLAGIVTALSTR